MADSTNTNSVSKKPRWSDRMVSQLTECLTAYKSKLEYQNKDLDAGRPVQYKEMRREMPPKVYDDVFEQFAI